jgi:hypothetical protein
MGQGGEGPGNTPWGQTELSCYDDSMHGIWGTSYKHHERAIVFSEKNRVRLRDVAYDPPSPPFRLRLPSSLPHPAARAGPKRAEARWGRGPPS